MRQVLLAADARQLAQFVDTAALRSGIPIDPAVTDNIIVRTVQALGTKNVAQVVLAVEHVFHDSDTDGVEHRYEEVFTVEGASHRDPKDAPNITTGLLLAEARALEAAAKRLRKKVNGRIKHADDIKQARKDRRTKAQATLAAGSKKTGPKKIAATKKKAIATPRTRAISAGKAVKATARKPARKAVKV